MKLKTGKVLALTCLVALATACTARGAALPGEYTIRTLAKNTYLTARPGMVINSVITTATSPGPSEKFRFERMLTGHLTIKTLDNRHYVSAAGGGGYTAPAEVVLSTDRTDLHDEARFRIKRSLYGHYTIKPVINDYYLTAWDGGGRATDAFRTNMTKEDLWERYWVNQCGAIGDQHTYTIVPRATGLPLLFLPNLVKGGAYFKGTWFYETTDSLIFQRQPTGWYALGIKGKGAFRYVTAAGGGGWSKNLPSGDVLQTNRTQVQAWETFAFMVQPDCSWTIQTANGSFMGVNGVGNISTAIPNPRTGANLGYNVYFELRPKLD